MAKVDDRTERKFKSIRQGRLDSVNTLSLALTPATTTTVTHPACSSTSHVSLSPTSSAAKTEGIPQVTPGNGSFVLTHSASASARTYSFAIFTPSVA